MFPPDLIPLPEDAYGQDGHPYQTSYFKEHQKAYFADLLGRKWECDIAGHAVCIPTKDGKHHRISEENLGVWVEEMCLGAATTAQPPEGVLTSFSNDTPSNRAEGSLRAVSVPPSHRRNTTSPALAATASLRESLEEYSTSCPSSGIPGPGYLSGKALKWLGKKSINTLEDAIIMKRACQHRIRLNLWKMFRGTPFGKIHQRELFEMLEEALEMSRPCYSFRVNKYATVIGSLLVEWTIEQSNALSMMETSISNVRHIRACLTPLTLVERARLDSRTRDVTWELLDAITRVPAALQDSEATSIVICILAKELAYSPYRSDHRWMERNLYHILDLTLHMRLLTPEELSTIHAMAARHLLQKGDEDHWCCRPKQLVIFAQCASQDAWFKEVVLGPCGLKSLTSALDVALSKAIIDQNEDYSDLNNLIIDLDALLGYAWVAKTVEPKALGLLLNAFRQRTPEDWFDIRCWAIRAIRRIISQQPALLLTLIQEDAAPAFTSFASAPMPRETSPYDKPFREGKIDDARSLVRQMEEFST